MTELFLKIVNMSISASWVVLAVLLLRQVLKKAPKWVNVLLWGMVAFRLICPFTFESVLSLIPSAETVNTAILTSDPEINSGFAAVDNIINPVIGEVETTIGPEKTINTFKLLVWIFARVWLIGIAVMLIYALVSYLRVRLKVNTAVRLKDNVYQSEAVMSPFVLGFIEPKIYLPYNMSEQDTELVVAHETAHIKRKDHMWKPLGFSILTLHWFNPLMWLAYVLLCRDIEIACDEKVVKELTDEYRADYSQALLTCSVNRRLIAACPLAFGEVSVKQRVKAVLKYKKPAVWAVIFAVIAVGITAVCMLTSPSGVPLNNIEFLNLVGMPQNTVSILKYNGENYEAIPAFSKDKLNELLNIYISKNEASPSRSEDRDKTHTLILQTKNNLTPGVDNGTSGTAVCFNENFTEVWVDNHVKPTLSYRVIKPKKAQQIYEDICNMVGVSGNENNAEPLTDGLIQFYNEPTDEHNTPIIETTAQMSESDLNAFLERIEKQNWTFDALVDRLTHYYDCRISYGDFIYVGFEQKVIYCKEYFTWLTDEDAELIKSYNPLISDDTSSWEKLAMQLKLQDIPFDRLWQDSAIFDTESEVLKISDSDLITVYQFENAQVAKLYAEGVSPDGFSVSQKEFGGIANTGIYEFIDKPHWYINESSIVLYIGNNPEVLDCIKAVFGEQFAGQ